MKTTRTRECTVEDWVRLYREGVTCAGIAQLCEDEDILVILRTVAESKERDATLEADHLANRLGAAEEVQAYKVPEKSLRPSWQARAAQLKEFVDGHEGRMPRQRGGDETETALGRWLHAQRGKVAKGTLTTAQRLVLESIGDWDSDRRAKRDELSFPARVREVTAFRARHKRWPTYMTRNDPDERALGVWLHTLRLADRDGRLPATTSAALDRHLPGWRG